MLNIRNGQMIGLVYDTVENSKIKAVNLAKARSVFNYFCRIVYVGGQIKLSLFHRSGNHHRFLNSHRDGRKSKAI